MARRSRAVSSSGAPICCQFIRAFKHILHATCTRSAVCGVVALRPRTSVRHCVTRYDLSETATYCHTEQTRRIAGVLLQLACMAQAMYTVLYYTSLSVSLIQYSQSNPPLHLNRELRVLQDVMGLHRGTGCQFSDRCMGAPCNRLQPRGDR